MPALAVNTDVAIDQDLAREAEQIALAQRGQLDALRPIFERYAGPLYSTVIRPRIGASAIAEEVLRDTFSTAVEKIDRFTWQGKSIYPWLRQIAVNKIIDRHRGDVRRRKLAAAVMHEFAHETAPESHADAQLIADEERNVHRAKIEAALAALPERYRRAIEVRLIEERSRELCAAEFGITVANFDVVLFRAVRAFRKRFGEESPT